MVDLTESGDTFQTLNGVDGGLRSQMAVNLLYANGHDLTDPYLSPLFADLSGFPPTFLQSGTETCGQGLVPPRLPADRRVEEPNLREHRCLIPVDVLAFNEAVTHADHCYERHNH